MHSPITAVIDACVLYVAPLRDLVIRLGQAQLIHPRWTLEIHHEWMRNLLLNNRNILPDRLERTRQLMDQAIPASLVAGYEPYIDTLTLPDPNDRHVLAASIRCGATHIVTFNLSDFPAGELAKYNIATLSPDELITRLLVIAPKTVAACVRQQRGDLKTPPKSVDEFLSSLEKVGLPMTVARLRTLADQL